MHFIEQYINRIYHILSIIYFLRINIKMPVERGHDAKGPFYRWGTHGKKYRYTAGNPSSRVRAQNKAAKQGRAIQASKHRNYK